MIVPFIYLDSVLLGACCLFNYKMVHYGNRDHGTLSEYRTAECILDWIDPLAFTVFHLSLDEDCNVAELLY